MTLSYFTRVCLPHGSKLWSTTNTTHHGNALCQFSSSFTRLSRDLHRPSPSLMRAVIIPCTGPDNPANEGDGKMKKPNTLLIHSSGALCCSLNHRSRQHVPRLSFPRFELGLILHFCRSLVGAIILLTQAVPP